MDVAEQESSARLAGMVSNESAMKYRLTRARTLGIDGAGREPKCQRAGECPGRRLDPHRQGSKIAGASTEYALTRHSSGTGLVEKTHSTQITGHPGVTAHSIAVPSMSDSPFCSSLTAHLEQRLRCQVFTGTLLPCALLVPLSRPLPTT
jgi:hypothetical protein